jgi:hypothetical protein
MNPFERIEEMKEILKSEVINNGIKGSDTITQAEHYKRMLGMLSILEEELEQAEYNYQVESINREVKTFDEQAVLYSQLNEDVVIFQPVQTNEEYTMVDLQSLADVLRKLHDSGQIKENIILLPPDINVFRAVLAK